MSNLKSQIYISNVKSNNVKVRSYQFSIKIIKFVNKLPSKRAFWVIGDQLIRSATSIGANMMEGQSSSSRREFIKYYEISLKSSNETKYWLSLLKDSFVELKNEIEILLKENEEISRMIASSILTLKNKNRY